MKLNRKRFQQPARFELLPLLDVIFLLLIFFIFVMLKMTMQNSIKIELPQLIDSQPQVQQVLTISINENNQIFINEQQTSKQKLIAEVIRLQLLQQQEQNQKQEQNTELPILIHGDKQADLGVALQILDQLRLSGFHKVAFATEK
jgi:biopolymer transport protein ExbD